MRASEESNRLLIATFIVGTAVAVYFSNAILPVEAGTWQAFIVSALIVSLLASAALAFIYLLVRGYKLRYKKKSNNFIDKYGHIFYDLSIKAYAPILILSIIALVFKWLNESFDESAGQLINIVFSTVLGLGFVVFFNRDLIIDYVDKRRIKKKGEADANSHNE